MSALLALAGPLAEPLSLAELKAHLRLEDESEEALLAGYLIAAREAVERHLRRALIAQRWQLVLDAWPTGPVRLPRPPLLSVEAVRVLDAAGGATLVPPSDYRVETRAEPGFLLAAAGTGLPAPGLYPSGIEIEFVAGYGETWNAVPSPIRQALLMMVSDLFESRLNAAPAIAGTVRSLLDPWRMVRL